jgi:hypothetical protein
MDCKTDIYRQNLHERDLTGLAKLCANVANSHSANHRQSETAYTLRLEWLRLRFDRSPQDDQTGTQRESLRERMAEFLAGIPIWMSNGW